MKTFQTYLAVVFWISFLGGIVAMLVYFSLTALLVQRYGNTSDRFGTVGGYICGGLMWLAMMSAIVFGVSLLF